MRPTSGARALQTSCADVIAGLAAAIHVAKRVRDMRKYPFWARGAELFEIRSVIAPGKILRDSPAALPHAQKKMLRMRTEADVLASKF